MQATPAKVLVVEDNEYNREMLAQWLAKLGHQGTKAGDGREALEILGRQTCDLVLLDIMMPELNGYQVLEQLRSEGRRDYRREPEGRRFVVHGAPARSGPQLKQRRPAKRSRQNDKETGQ